MTLKTIKKNLKLVILAGGLGTRITEETTTKPKPMVEIGGKPILWHILKIYSFYDINEFIICCGYKGKLIKDYFLNYNSNSSDFTLDLKTNTINTHNSTKEDWKITLVDTGSNTMTGGRLAKVKDFIGKDTFCFTYGDGLADINIKKLIEFHKKQGRKATLTAVQPPGRFGVLDLEGSTVKSFQEKPVGDNSWISGGFFVLEPSVIDFVDGDNCIWEDRPLKILSQKIKFNLLISIL